MLEQLLTPKEVAAKWGVSASLLRKHSGENGRKPQVPAVKMINGKWRYSPTVITQWFLDLQAREK